jgi:hypothetical protein
VAQVQGQVQVQVQVQAQVQVQEAGPVGMVTVMVTVTEMHP